MVVEDSVAQDQLRAFIERIERMEEEKAAIAADIKEIYAEAKGNGFDTKILRKIVTIRKQDANERMEQEALLEMYMSALGMVEAHEASLDAALRRGTNRHSAPLSFGRVEAITEPQPTKAAGQAGATAAVGDLAHEPAADEVIPRTVENEAAEISTPITEKQASPEPASDLTSSQAPQGEVATIQPETANEMHQSASHNDEPSSEVGPQAEASPAGTGTEMLAGREARHEGEAASAVLPTPSRADRIKALRPLCQRPEACGSSGGKKHCHSCVTAAESQEEHA